VPEEEQSLPNWRLWLSEALGTALLVGSGLTAAALVELRLIPPEAGRSVVPGLTILALISMLSDLSGAHFNPAVTLAFALRGSFPWARVPGYVAAQVLGALLTGILVAALLPAPHFRAQVVPVGVLALEVVCTAALVLVILAAAKRKAVVGPQAGLVIGGTLALCGLSAGSVATVTLNTGLGLGGAVANHDWSRAWPHLLGPLLGAALATGLTWALRGGMNGQEQAAAQGENGGSGEEKGEGQDA
jgi:aquaporin Z